MFSSISSGHYDNEIAERGVDEVSQVLRALGDMQGKLRAQIETERRQAEENARVRAALDNVSSNVMVADPSFNDHLYQPGRSLDAERGGGRHPQGPAAVQRRQHHGRERRCALEESGGRSAHATRSCVAPIPSEVTLGRRTFKVVANPVTDSHGARAGTVFEWTDRTQEVGVEGEMQSMLSAVLSGDLEQSHRRRWQGGLLRRP